MRFGLGRRGKDARDLAAASDEELLVAAQRGESRAFETLVGRYTGPLYAFAARMVGPDDAPDVTQHVFIQCHGAMPRLRADTSLRPWLYRVARNRCLDLLRQRRALPVETPRDNGSNGDDAPDALAQVADAGPSLETLAERDDLQRVLTDAIGALPPKYREVVLLRYAGELTFAEIAETLGIPENSAKTLFQRAKGMLRVSLREWAADDPAPAPANRTGHGSGEM